MQPRQGRPAVHGPRLPPLSSRSHIASAFPLFSLFSLLPSDFITAHTTSTFQSYQTQSHKHGFVRRSHGLLNAVGSRLTRCPAASFHHESDERQAYEAVYGGQEHQSKWSHELIAGAAAFEAEKKCVILRPPLDLRDMII